MEMSLKFHGFRQEGSSNSGKVAEFQFEVPVDLMWEIQEVQASQFEVPVDLMWEIQEVQAR